MDKQFYGSALCGEADVRYFLLVEEPGETAARIGGLSAEDAAAWNRTEYGVAVEKGGEETSLLALDSSLERVQDLLDRMVRGAVTPVSARDVAEDWLLAQ